MFFGMFGQTKRDPKEQIRDLKKKLRHEQNGIRRQMNRIQYEEEKVKKQIKDAAKKGDKDVCMILAKSMVQSRKQKNRMHMSVTQIESIMMQMQHQLAAVRMAGAIKQSSEVMKSMQQLVKVPEIMATMREMSKEMTKAGIMGEMIEETMEALEPEELEEQAAEEVEKVLWEITEGELGKAPAAVKDKLGASKEADKEINAEAEALISRIQTMNH